jgi:hypothetical protein
MRYSRKVSARWSQTRRFSVMGGAFDPPQLRGIFIPATEICIEASSTTYAHCGKFWLRQTTEYPLNVVGAHLVPLQHIRNNRNSGSLWTKTKKKYKVLFWYFVAYFMGYTMPRNEWKVFVNNRARGHSPKKYDPLYLPNRSSEYVQIFTDTSDCVPHPYLWMA